MAAPEGQQADGAGMPGVEAAATTTDAGQVQLPAGFHFGWGPMGYGMYPNDQIQAVQMINPAQLPGAGAAPGMQQGMMQMMPGAGAAPSMQQGMMQMTAGNNAMQQMTAQQVAMANGGGWNGMQGINQPEPNADLDQEVIDFTLDDSDDAPQFAAPSDLSARSPGDAGPTAALDLSLIGGSHLGCNTRRAGPRVHA